MGKSLDVVAFICSALAIVIFAYAHNVNAAFWAGIALVWQINYHLK